MHDIQLGCGRKIQAEGLYVQGAAGDEDDEQDATVAAQARSTELEAQLKAAAAAAEAAEQSHSAEIQRLQASSRSGCRLLRCSTQEGTAEVCGLRALAEHMLVDPQH